MSESSNKEKEVSVMYDVCVIAKSGIKLMPTSRVKARKLLRAGKAIIVSYMPFAIQLTYKSEHNTQPVEICVDTGSEHIGVSVKSEKHEYLHLQLDNLKDEKIRHEARKMYRCRRRNRLRYRKARFNNRRIPEGWLAPSIKHKKDNHTDIIARIVKVCPINSILIEVGQFDPALMRAKDKGETLEGVDYQHGPAFGLANKREAVFVRDNYTCKVCGKSITDGVILRTHHNIHRSLGGSDSVDNLVTVCEKCHTPKNHKPGKPLESGAFGKLPSLKDASFMNIVRWFIVDEIKDNFPDVEVRATYGSYTKDARRKLGQLAKSHANDAYAMGDFHPKHKAHEIVLKKRRRNNRVLSKFYDAKYIDLRTGEIKSGSELSCNRTNRREPRKSEKSERVFRERKVRTGRVSTRRQRYTIQAGDKVEVAGVVFNSCHGVMTGGKSVFLLNARESATGKAVTASVNKVKILRRAGGWLYV